MHPSRVVHFVIDVPDLDQGVKFWSAALGEPIPARAAIGAETIIAA